MNNTAKLLTCCILSLVSGYSPAAQTPEDTYRTFHSAMLAGDFDTLLQLSPESIKAEISDYTPDLTQGMMAWTGKFLPRNYSVVRVTPGASANVATLYATGVSEDQSGGQEQKLYGVITMIEEGGAWKIGKSDWSSAPPKPVQIDSGTVVANAGDQMAPVRPVASDTPPTVAPKLAPAVAAPAAPAPVAAAPVQSKPPQKKKPVCIIKQVMTNAEINACREASADR